MAPAVEARASDPRPPRAYVYAHPACTCSRCRRGVLRGDGGGPGRPSPHRGASTSGFGTRRETTAPTADAEATLGRTGTPGPPTEPAVLEKSGDRPTKTRSFCAITPRFLRRGGSAAAKGRKAARNHGCNHRKDKNINFSPPNHQQKHVFTPCISGEIQAEIRTFRRLGRKQEAEYSFYFKASRTKNRKRIDNAQEDAPQIVHFHASPHSLCPLGQRWPAPTLKINVLSFRFVGHNGRKTLASGAQFPVFCASLTTKIGYFTSEGR